MSTGTTAEQHPALEGGRHQRLLAPAPPAPLPRLDLPGLLSVVHQAGLTGRGGAGFPTARKIDAVARARGRAVVVGNAMEGEPLSRKDAVLLARNPGLVLDGLDVVAAALGTRRRVLALGPLVPAGAVTAQAQGRGTDVRRLDGGFVAGQETALVNQLEGRAAVPRDPLVRVTERGLGGRPTLVLNAETLAHVGLVARHGVAWYREAGTADDPGTMLLSVSGAVGRPGVLEVERGTPLEQAVAGARPVYPVAVLVGGYHGAWVPRPHLDVPLSNAALAPFGATVGAGVVHVLGHDTCPLRLTATVAGYLAGESAGQCGPCVNGLPRIADSLSRLARLSPDPSLPGEVERLARLVERRGACAHPDGTVRLVRSTLRTFEHHVREHLAGTCSMEGRSR